MAPSRLGEQEFVAHLFAPLDGPNAALAAEQIRSLWDNCRLQLGMTQPIVGAGLVAELPADVPAQPDGALAGLQDPGVNFQAIARREHDVLNVSLVMVAPDAPPRRRQGLGSAAPSGWHEFARWWRLLTADGTGALLGGATIYQAKTADLAGADVRAELPAQDDDAAAWWTRGLTVDGFACWEVTPGGDRAMRRLVVLARPDEDARLSRFTWSSGDVALPPLGRYLMHAAKLRYQARVRGDGREMTLVRDRTRARLDRLTGLLHDPAAAAEVGPAKAALAADEASLIGTLEALRQLRRTVDIARGNMASVLPLPLPSDVTLADWLVPQLDDDAEYLEATRSRAERMHTITRAVPPPAPAATVLFTPPPPESAPPRDTRVRLRLGFGVDVVDYSGRTTPQQTVVQDRLARLVERVLNGVGLRLHDTDRQDAGDGMMVVLPPDLEMHRVLPGLLHGWRAELVADNGAHPEDRIRLRLSVAAGQLANSAIGFTGATIIEMGRLLDSAALRRAVVEHPDADLVALVSERLHADVVGEGFPGLDPDQFQQLLAETKSYRKPAWLWTGGPATAAARPAPAASAAPMAQPAPPASTPDPRDVFVIDDRNGRAGPAVRGLLRALNLHPLEWEELVKRTGEPTPLARAVLDQAFIENQAAVVVISPGGGGPAGSEVLMQAGMALALQRDRTVVVEIGRPPKDSALAGLEVITFDGRVESLHRIAQRLRNAGCAVDTEGTDWLDLGRFTGLDLTGLDLTGLDLTGPDFAEPDSARPGEAVPGEAAPGEAARDETGLDEGRTA